VHTITKRFIRVWERNLTVYRKNWKVSFVPPLLEPLFYLLAFGVGLSALVGNVPYEGRQITYIQFIAPALISVSIMYNSFFETTYTSYVRMYYQKTFDAMMSTPLSLEEIITGEIIWGATKSVIAAAIMMAVISMFGLISFPLGLSIIPLAFLGGIAFGSVGMLFTGMVANIDQFNLPIFLLVTPMFLFSGTFFPIDTLPAWARHLAEVLPLTHLVDMVRSLSYGETGIRLLWDLAYLAVFSLVFFMWALRKMRARLIK